MRTDRTKGLTLALQGGGSHGAYTWGVLDCLFADRGLRVTAISGASAGALNAAVAAHGLALEGPDGARAGLDRFWDAIANTGEPFHGWGTLWNDTEPALRSLSALNGMLSPSQLNPLELDPLRHILAKQIDFERIRSGEKFRLFVAATEVTTGRLRVYHTHEIDLSVLLASACLPRWRQPVRIGEQSYWDGGLTANPPILPLLQHESAQDLMLVTLLPEVQSVPPSSADITQRLNDIAFGSGLHANCVGRSR